MGKDKHLNRAIQIIKGKECQMGIKIAENYAPAPLSLLFLGYFHKIIYLLILDFILYFTSAFAFNQFPPYILS